MAARFHLPQPRPARRRRPHTPPLTAVPDRLAPVLPMPQPGVRPTRLVLLTCPVCDYAADLAPAAEAEQAAGVHDDQHHGGRATAELRRIHTVGQRRPSSGPDLGGAA